MELLNSAEAADYLRLKERKLYELVSDRAVPCTKVTGRWLFPKAELDRWLAAGLINGAVSPPEAAPIIGGSHDPLLEWALRESGAGLAILAEGSEAGLGRFTAGKVLAAAIHLHSLDDPACDANVAAATAYPRSHETVLIAFARREQGLVVDAANKHEITGVADAVRKGMRIAQRPRGAGAQLLLLALLQRDGVNLDSSARGPLCPTGPDIAQAIQTGHADCGIASRAIAVSGGLGFVPLLWERFDLFLHQRDYFGASMQKLLNFTRSARFAKRAHEMTGYDVSDSGAVRFVQ